MQQVCQVSAAHDTPQERSASKPWAELLPQKVAAVVCTVMMSRRSITHKYIYAHTLPLLLRHGAWLPPLQVYLTASANATVGYVFNGITPRDDLKWVPKHLTFFDQTMAGVMRSVGSDMAGGYDKVSAAELCALFEPFFV
jgi:hypothetical protein